MPRIFFVIFRHLGWYGVILPMDREAFREALREIGQKGGLARAKNLSASERTRIATKASKAAAKARTAKARARKQAS